MWLQYDREELRRARQSLSQIVCSGSCQKMECPAQWKSLGAIRTANGTQFSLNRSAILNAKVPMIQTQTSPENEKPIFRESNSPCDAVLRYSDLCVPALDEDSVPLR